MQYFIFEVLPQRWIQLFFFAFVELTCRNYFLWPTSENFYFQLKIVSRCFSNNFLQMSQVLIYWLVIFISVGSKVKNAFIRMRRSLKIAHGTLYFMVFEILQLLSSTSMFFSSVRQHQHSCLPTLDIFTFPHEIQITSSAYPFLVSNKLPWSRHPFPKYCSHVTTACICECRIFRGPCSKQAKKVPSFRILVIPMFTCPYILSSHMTLPIAGMLGLLAGDGIALSALCTALSEPAGQWQLQCYHGRTTSRICQNERNFCSSCFHMVRWFIYYAEKLQKFLKFISYNFVNQSHAVICTRDSRCL